MIFLHAEFKCWFISKQDNLGTGIPSFKSCAMGILIKYGYINKTSCVSWFKENALLW